MSTFYFMAVIVLSLKSLAPYQETSVGGEAWKVVLDEMRTNFETALGFQGVKDRRWETDGREQGTSFKVLLYGLFPDRKDMKHAVQMLSFAKLSTWWMGKGAWKLWELKSDYLRLTASSYHTKSESKVHLSSLAWLNKLLETHALGTRDHA